MVHRGTKKTGGVRTSEGHHLGKNAPVLPCTQASGQGTRSSAYRWLETLAQNCIEYKNTALLA